MNRNRIVPCHDFTGNGSVRVLQAANRARVPSARRELNHDLFIPDCLLRVRSLWRALFPVRNRRK